MKDARVAEVLAGEEAWIVGGAIRDSLLGRPVLDVDVACREPRAAAKRFAKRFGGAPFPLSERHGAWRVVTEGTVETVDFTPLPGGIDADLATRDFTFNAIAVRVGGGDVHDPHGGRADLEAGIVRAVTETVFVDDPLRLLRAVRLEDELGFRHGRAHGRSASRVFCARHAVRRRARARRAPSPVSGRLSPTRRGRPARARWVGLSADRWRRTTIPTFVWSPSSGSAFDGSRSHVSSADTQPHCSGRVGPRTSHRGRFTAFGGRPSRGRRRHSHSSAPRSCRRRWSGPGAPIRESPSYGATS